MNSIEIESMDEGVYVVLNDGEACVFLSLSQAEDLLNDLHKAINGSMSDES